ncbi:hypothetical protein RB595_009638 [Gaeumannomyces hyphopodioides]
MSNFCVPSLGGLRPGLLSRGVRAAARSSLQRTPLEPCIALAAGRCYSTYRAQAGRLANSSHRSPKKPPSSITTATQWRPAMPIPPAGTMMAQQRRHLSGSRRVITHYMNLPSDYTDEEGLPFTRSGELSQREIIDIFGVGISTRQGNILLRILHGRRVAGSLEDPRLAPNTAVFSKAEMDKALGYLRRTVPVNEVINAGLRAEDELLEIEEEEAAKAAAAQGAGSSEQQAPAYPNAGGSKWQQRLFKTQPGGDVYGEGVIDRIRKRNEAKWREELKQREEAKRLKEEEEARLNPGGLAKVDEPAPKQLSPRMLEYTERATSDLAAPPEMSKARRLAPTLLTAVAVVAGGLAAADLYQAPRRDRRLLPDVPPAAATVGALVLLNLAVYAAWRVPMLWRFMNRHFILTSATPKPHVALLVTASHQSLKHLLLNMVFLWPFGTRLHDDLGRGPFLAVYVGCGLLGFAGSLTALVLQSNLAASTMGASGAVYGIMAAYFTIHRFEGFKVFGLPPDPYDGAQGLGFLALLTANVLLQFRRNVRLDVWSHLAGLLGGVLYGFYFSGLAKDRGSVRGSKELAELPALDETRKSTTEGKAAGSS